MAKTKEKTRKDGLIEKKKTIGKTLDGKPIRKSFYGHSGREIEAKFQEYLKNSNSEYVEVNKLITLKEWADRWLATYRAGTKAITYNNTYRSPIENHIKPYFKDRRLAALRPLDIQQFANHIMDKSESIVSKCSMIIKAMFEDAVENGIIASNPARKIKFVSNYESKEKRAYSKREARHFIAFAKRYMNSNPEGGAAPIIMIKAGLGRAEVIALDWERDIDLKNQTLTVNKSVSETNGKIEIGNPKTKARKATVPFDDELKHVLLSIPRKEETSLVFSNKHIKVHSPSNWSRRHYAKYVNAYDAHCKKKGYSMRALEPHELRHTFGSLIYEATKDIYITSKLMRHSSIDITAKIYVHESMDTKRKALDMMNGISTQKNNSPTK